MGGYVMEKVKLTQKQAEDLEEALHAYEDDKDHMINESVRAKDTTDSDSISYFSASKIAKAIYIGYEVKSYKIDDWVKVEIQNEVRVSEIYAIKGDKYFLERLPGYFKAQNILDHATDEEIAEEKEYRWWFRHNRDVWELRKGDVLILNDHGYHIVDQIVKDEKETLYWFVSPDGPGNITQQQLIDEGLWEWRVVYFYEDRKDR